MDKTKTLKFSFLILLLLFTGTVQAQHFNYHTDYRKVLEQTRNKTDSLYYDNLRQRFLVNDSTMTVYEVLALMIGYTGQPAYRPYEQQRTENRIYKLNNEGQFGEVIRICDSFLAKHPLNQQAIIEKAYAFHKTDQPDSSRFYKEQFGRIMAAMDWSGEGKTPETAMFAIGPADGQNFIRKYYRGNIGITGSDRDEHGNLCDVLEMKFEQDGEEKSTILYFVIEHAAASRQLSPAVSKTIKKKSIPGKKSK